MPQIEIDEQVFAWLQAQAEPLIDTPNTVLRRLLEVDAPAQAREQSVVPGKARKRIRSTSKVGELASLLANGDIAVDDVLVYRKRSGEVYRGYVTNHGWIVVDDQSFPTPSGALKSAVGYDVNGWKLWTHEKTGKSLAHFRK